MIAFIKDNWATILVGIAVLGAVALAIRSMVKDKKCGKACGGCPYAGTCHKK